LGNKITTSHANPAQFLIVYNFMSKLVSQSLFEQKIFILRCQKVMLRHDLAELYHVPSKVLIQAVKRNKERFPDDFMFQLNNQEVTNLRSQSVTSSWGGQRWAPYAFTEHGIAMLSTVLKSRKAIQINIEIMRAFVALRQIAYSYKDLAERLKLLENLV
jgi:hypothetical protein